MISFSPSGHFEESRMKQLSWNDPTCLQCPCGGGGILERLQFQLGVFRFVRASVTSWGEREETDCWSRSGMKLHVRKLQGTLIGPCWAWALVQLLLHSPLALTGAQGGGATHWAVAPGLGGSSCPLWLGFVLLPLLQRSFSFHNLPLHLCGWVLVSGLKVSSKPLSSAD